MKKPSAVRVAPPAAAGEPPGGSSTAAVPSTEGPELRERILRASVELLEREGLSALSMREVARRAGVSHQAPYHHFPDRESILAAIAEDGFRKLGQMMDVPGSASLGVLERLQRAATAYVTFALSHPAHFRVMFRPELVHFGGFPSLGCAADEVYAHLEQSVCDFIASGRGWQRSEPAVIALCWSTVHGLASLLLDGPLSYKLPLHAAPGAPDGSDPQLLVRGVLAAFGRLMEVAHQRGPDASGAARPAPDRSPRRAPRAR